MKKILLILIGLSVFLLALEVTQFTKVNNTVSDSETGLEWQDNSDTTSSTYTWQEAINHCETLTLDTHDDWRLPNVNELKTLVDRSKRNPAIRGNVFEYVQSSYYWSSTSYVGDEPTAWFVHFYYGFVGWNGKYDNIYVRYVRDGQ